MPIENQPANNRFGEWVKILSSTYEPNRYSVGSAADTLRERLNQESKSNSINIQESILSTVAEILSAEPTADDDIFIAADGIVVSGGDVLRAQKEAIGAISFNLSLEPPEVLTSLASVVFSN